MTIIYQFLEGAKMGSLCGSHFGQIQDGRVLNINDITFVGLSSMGNSFMMLFCSFEVHVM